MRKQITITHFEGPDLSMVRCHFQAGGVNETIIGVKAVIFFFFLESGESIQGGQHHFFLLK